MIVYPAIVSDLEREPYPPRETILWGSDMGSCVRKAILRTRAEPVSLPFSASALGYMQAGNMWEAETLRALQKAYPGIVTQLELRTDLWSCKCDFVIGHNTGDPIIVEHKATGDKWWNYKNGLPKPEHIGQLWLYGNLYTQKFGIVPKLVLFYRSWGHYAEYAIGQDGRNIVAAGEMDGTPVSKVLPIEPDRWKVELEFAFHERELPPVLRNPDDGCLFNGKPSCAYYHSCW